MTPTELRLFTASEQTLLVSTEPARLKELSEDELADLLPRVRRLRNKHRDQHRTQARKTKKTSGNRGIMPRMVVVAARRTGRKRLTAESRMAV